MEPATDLVPTTLAADVATVRLTDSAITHVKRLLTENQMDGYGLRFGLQGGGCSGYTYDLGFEESPQPEDEVHEFDGVKVFVNPLHVQYLRGSEVDYRDELIGAGFHIENPNVKRSCGCGTSFDV